MTGREPLSKTVSVQELRYMREEQHLTNTEIAKRLDVHPSTIGRYLGPADPLCCGKNKNSGKRLTDDMIVEIRKMYSEGRSINNISEKLGVGWGTVKRHVSGMSRGRKEPKHEAEKPFVFDAPETLHEPEHEPEQIAPKETVPMFEVISKKQTVRLKGDKSIGCSYLVEINESDRTLTIEYEGTEVSVLDPDSLNIFIGELQRIRDEYLKEVI